MSRQRLLLIVLLCVLPLLAIRYPEQPMSEKVSLPITGSAGAGLEAFDKLMLELVKDAAVPGAALALVKDGRLVLIRGYGYADLRGRRLVQPHTVFALASISKTFTALAILRLIDRGKLSLDAPIAPLIADLAEGQDSRLSAVTIRHLLNHSSGMRFLAVMPNELHKDLPQLSLALKNPLQFEPGTKTYYSNLAYNTLGHIITKVSGQSYADFVRAEVLLPLGVTRASIPADEADYGPEEAHRYSNRGLPLKARLLPFAGPSGGWAISPFELARFMSALQTQSGFLSPELWKEMLAPPQRPQRPRSNGTYFGLGWDRVEKGPRGLTYSKNARLEGMYCSMGHDASGVEYVAMFNGGNDDMVAHRANNGLRTLIRARQSWPAEDYFKPHGGRI